MDRRVGGIELSDSARHVKVERTLLERLDLNQACAIGLLVQAIPGLGRTLYALETLVNVVADACGVLLRVRLMRMGGSRPCSRR